MKPERKIAFTALAASVAIASGCSSADQNPYMINGEKGMSQGDAGKKIDAATGDGFTQSFSRDIIALCGKKNVKRIGTDQQKVSCTKKGMTQGENGVNLTYTLSTIYNKKNPSNVFADTVAVQWKGEEIGKVTVEKSKDTFRVGYLNPKGNFKEIDLRTMTFGEYVQVASTAGAYLDTAGELGPVKEEKIAVEPIATTPSSTPEESNTQTSEPTIEEQSPTTSEEVPTHDTPDDVPTTGGETSSSDTSTDATASQSSDAQQSPEMSDPFGSAQSDDSQSTDMQQSQQPQPSASQISPQATQETMESPSLQSSEGNSGNQNDNKASVPQEIFNS